MPDRAAADLCAISSDLVYVGMITRSLLNFARFSGNKPREIEDAIATDETALFRVQVCIKLPGFNQKITENKMLATRTIEDFEWVNEGKFDA